MPDTIITAAPLPFDSDVAQVSLEAYAPKAAGGTGPLNIDGIDVTGAAAAAGHERQ